MARLAYFALFVALSVMLSCLEAAGSSATAAISSSYQTNISITGVYVASNVSVYSPLPVLLNVTNTGKFASGNIFVGLQIYGTPQVLETFNFSGLSPGQSELILMYLNNVTGATGGHTIYFTSGYIVDGIPYQTGKAISGYTVVGSNFARQAGIEGSASLPNVNTNYIPYIEYMLENSSLLSQLVLSYNGAAPSSISISIPTSFSTMLSLSTDSLYLQDGQSLSTSILFNPPSQQYESTYVIPITLTSVQNGATTGTAVRYVRISTLNASGSVPEISERLALLNDSSSSSATVQINSPSGYNMYNAKLQLTIPSAITANAIHVNAYGSQSTVTNGNGSYTIEWYLGDVQRSQVLYLYYDIYNLTDAAALADQQFILSSTTLPAQNSNFNVTGTVLPVFYANTTGQIQINLIYTGTSNAQATFYLPSTQSATVQNSTHTVNVTPNEQLQQTFVITANNYSGTALLKFYADVNGVNSTFNLPVVILEKPTDLPGLILYTLSRYRYEIIGGILIILAIVGAVAYALKKRNEPKKHDPESTKQLIQVREQMSASLEPTMKAYAEIRSSSDLQKKGRKIRIVLYSSKALANIAQNRDLKLMGGNNVVIFKQKELTVRKEGGNNIVVSVEGDGKNFSSSSEKELNSQEEAMVIAYIKDKDKDTWIYAVVLKSPKADFEGLGELSESQ